MRCNAKKPEKQASAKKDKTKERSLEIRGPDKRISLLRGLPVLQWRRQAPWRMRC